MTHPDPEMRPIFCTRPGEGRELLERWLATPALRQLVEAEGVAWPTGDLAAVLGELVRFSARWDYRGGADSRLMFHAGDESRTDARAQLVYAAARDLGLLDSPAPTLPKPDYLIILGGLATGVEPRVRYASELIELGSVSTDKVVALGSFRPLDARESEAAGRYAPGALTELDLLAAMAGVVFGDGLDWTTTTEGDQLSSPAQAQEIRRRAGHPEITLYAARSSDPDHRAANTVDTYEQFAHDVDLDHDQALLIITSTIYRPYQHLDALGALGPYGVTIETIGVPTRPGSSPTHPPSAYLQELRSTLRSARALVATVS